MADVKMPKSMPCKFNAGGYAPCKKPSTNGWCSQHERAKCISCGEKAVRTCDEGMGGLACGAYLCKTCQHVEGGRHVKKQVAEVRWEEERKLREEGVMSRRMLEERGLPTDIQFPGNLKHLVDKTGYVLETVYSLALTHRLMGYFPAILRGTKRVLMSRDVSLVIRLWQKLDPRDSYLAICNAWVNPELGICYPVLGDTHFDLEESHPFKLLTEAEFNELTRDGKWPFEWAPGLIGAQISEMDFHRYIDAVARTHGVAQASIS